MNGNTSPPARRAPAWIILLFVLGIPMAVTVIGISIGAHAAEIVVFSLLCLFSLALVMFYALG
jgi:ABC-type methionine transport system permease subunit